MLDVTPIDTVTRLPNQAVGDNLCIPKDPLITRLHFQNVNGASINQTGTWDLLLEHYKEMEIDIALGCEHKLDTNIPYVHRRLYEGATRTFGINNCTIVAVATPTEIITKGQSSHKPGGSMATVIGKPRGRLIETGKDKLGRWVYLKFQRMDQLPLTIISTYQVVDCNPKEVGDTTYANQLLAAYEDSKYTDPHKLRKHHSNDLVKFVKECQSKGESVIVAGDFNEVLGSATDGLTRLCSECGLVDIVATNHVPMEFATHSQGSTVIDYILVAPDLLPAVKSCGYEPFNVNILSDHRGMYVDFSSYHLFGDNIKPLAPISARDISTKKPHQLDPYF
jgi:hypothetical protein